ncbi:MAG: mechanosensitive ion channel [Desulfobacterales bacterium]|jgi:small conductance mechanosensitive channel
MENIFAKVYEILTVYGLKVLAAIAILIIGRMVSKLVSNLTHKLLRNRNVDPTITSFVSNLTYYALFTFVILAALTRLGIQTTSFIAVIGAAGLAVGLALQGSLSNFAAGFLLIIFRPFKVGDFIEGGGTAGVVEKIQIFTTTLKTPDNKTIIVPNTKLTEDNIVNYSTEGTRRVDMVFGIGYGDDIDKARQIILDVMAADDRILKDPKPSVAVSELADSSVNFVVRPWSTVANYWGVMFDTTEKVKKRFDEEGISIPFPQRDVHIYEHKEA